MLRRGRRERRWQLDQKFGNTSSKSQKRVWWLRESASIALLRSKHIQCLMVRQVCISILAFVGVILIDVVMMHHKCFASY